jgi:hypothetical protein
MTYFEPEQTTVTIRQIKDRYLLFNPNGLRVDSKPTEAEAMKTAKRLFPKSRIEVLP